MPVKRTSHFLDRVKIGPVNPRPEYQVPGTVPGYLVLVVLYQQRF